MKIKSKDAFGVEKILDLSTDQNGIHGYVYARDESGMWNFYYSNAVLLTPAETELPKESHNAEKSLVSLKDLLGQDVKTIEFK